MTAKNQVPNNHGLRRADTLMPLVASPRRCDQGPLFKNRGVWDKLGIALPFQLETFGCLT